MHIEVRYTQAKTAERAKGATRFLVAIAATLSESEKVFCQNTRKIQTRSASPVKIYHFPNKDVVTPATKRQLVDGERRIDCEAFAKNGLPLRTYVQGAGLNISYPGVVEIGWINHGDIRRFKAWLESELDQVAGRIQEAINAEVAETADHAVTTSIVTGEFSRPTVATVASDDVGREIF